MDIEEEELPATAAELGLPELNISNPAHYVKPPSWAAPANVRFGLKSYNEKRKTNVQLHPFKKNIVHILGNDPAVAHFYVGHPSVETQHACLFWHKDHHACCVSDAMSKTGTFVNGSLIGHEMRPLMPGDVIRLGRSSTVHELTALPLEMIPEQYRDSEPQAYVDAPPRPPPARVPTPPNTLHSPRPGNNGPAGGPDFGKHNNNFPERRFPPPNSPGPGGPRGPDRRFPPNSPGGSRGPPDRRYPPNSPGNRGPNNRHRTPPRGMDRRRSASPRQRQHQNNSSSPQMNRHRNNHSPRGNDRSFRPGPPTPGPDGDPRDRHMRDMGPPPGHDRHNDRGGPPPHMGRPGPPPGDRRPDFGQGPPPHENSPFRNDRGERFPPRDREFRDHGRDFGGPPGRPGPPPPDRGHPNDQGFDPHFRRPEGNQGPPHREDFREGPPPGGPRNRREYDNQRR